MHPEGHRKLRRKKGTSLHPKWHKKSIKQEKKFKFKREEKEPDWKRVYEDNEETFLQENFSFAILEKLKAIGIEQHVWDIYHLFYFVQKIPDDGTYLEIGSGHGGSVLCAYYASQSSGSCANFISIDPFIPYAGKIWSKEEFLENTKEIPRLRLIDLTSDEAKDQIDDLSVDLLFVDGSHDEEQVIKDIRNYWPKIKIEGMMLGHDYKHSVPGVVHAVRECFGWNKKIFDNSIWLSIKRE